MIISPSKPEQLLNWFHDDSEGQTILCILLAPATEDHAKVASVVEDVFAADAILGSEIALLVLHPDAEQPLEVASVARQAAFRGRQPDSEGVRDFFVSTLRDQRVFRDAEAIELRAAFAKRAAQEMAKHCSEFAQIFEVPTAALPALCVAVKGFDRSLVIRLAQDWSKADLLSTLREIRLATDNAPNLKAEFRRLEAMMPGGLHLAKRTIQESLDKQAQFSRVIASLASCHHANENDLMTLAEFIASGERTSEAFARAIDSLSFARSPRFQDDAQLKKARRFMARLEELSLGLPVPNDVISYADAISDRAQNLLARRNEVHKRISQIAGAKVSKESRHYSSLTRMKSILEGLNLAGDAGIKAAAAIGWLVKMLS